MVFVSELSQSEVRVEHGGTRERQEANGARVNRDDRFKERDPAIVTSFGLLALAATRSYLQAGCFSGSGRFRQAKFAHFGWPVLCRRYGDIDRSPIGDQCSRSAVRGQG